MKTEKPLDFPKVSLKKTGYKIRELRQNKNLSVNDLRDMLDVSDNNTIYHWEAGKNFPSINHLVKLAFIFNVCVDDILQLEK